MKMIMFRSSFETKCLMLLHCVIVFSQSLYENNDLKCNILNKESGDLSIKSLIEAAESRLKEVQINKEECSVKVNVLSKSYKDIMRMFNTGEYPNDDTIDDICARHPELIIKSEKDCHRYYNCSGEDPALSIWAPPNSPGFWPSKYKHECHYPYLFSEETMQCENYTDVKCGKRYEPTWECRYFRLQCKLSLCPSREARYPKCEDKKDGFFMAYTQFTNRYMICKNGRRIALEYCPSDDVWGVSSFPYNGECVHAYALPMDFYSNVGRLPSCRGKPNGNYQYPDRPCDAYYKCEQGVASAVKCPNNTVFDKKKGICDVKGICN